MADQFNDEVIDTYKQHIYHQSFHSDCSTCFKENRLIEAHRRVNNLTHEDLLVKHPALRQFDHYLNNLNPLD